MWRLRNEEIPAGVIDLYRGHFSRCSGGWRVSRIVPGVSSLFGSNKPKNLGVTFTSQDLTNAEAKAGTQIVTLAPNLPPSQSISFSGQKM